jgi:hypothetical protein
MEPIRVSRPPAGEMPVAVPGDMVLVQRPGLLAWAGAIVVYSAGFEFALRVAADVTCPETELPEPFALGPGNREHGTWLEVRFPDGRACGADLNANTWSGGNENLFVDFLYGESSDSAGVADSRWWVSPLPPPGPVELTLHLNGRAAPAGTGTLDGQMLLDAAARAELLLPASGGNPALPALAGPTAPARWADSAMRAKPATASASPREAGSRPTARTSCSARAGEPAQPASAARRGLRRWPNAASITRRT